MQDPEVLEEFKLEADEMLNESEDFLLAMEKGDNFSENFNGVFRSFHSLKGAAGMFEIEDLQAFMHKVETQFESLRVDQKVNQDQIDYFLKAIDGARKLLDGQNIDLDLNSFDQISGKTQEVPAQTHKEKAEELKKVATERIEKKVSHKKGLVFIVDDEPFICENLKDILSGYGYTTKTFTDPTLVLEAMVTDQPDLVCTDLKMPGLTGIQLLEKIREKKLSIPVIFISGYVDNKLLTEGIELGASGFLEKPFEEHQVISLCSQTVDRHRAKKLLNRSINFILYQFNDLDNYLQQKGKETLRTSLKEELYMILKLRKESGL